MPKIHRPLLDRRQLLMTAGVGAVAAIGPLGRAAIAESSDAGAAGGGKIRYCLNTSTIRGQKLPLVEEVEIASKAGYSGIEPWVREIDEYVKQGGKLNDLKKRIADAGLAVESAIGFANWIVDDEEKRKAGLESAKRDMETVLAIGGTRIAAPPVGATRQKDLDLRQAALRYRALLEVGAKIGVTPQLELWGFSQSLSRIGELLFVASESGHPDACLLPDVYHIYKGGSDFAGLKLIAGQAMHAFHMNDYPADPPRDKIGDADRVYPGDGVAPLNQIIRDLHARGFEGAFSLELFNRSYWKEDALQVAQTGLAKMKAAVVAALG